MATAEPDATDYLLRHLVLPPKLPQADDSHPNSEKILLETTIASLRNLQSDLSTTEPVLAQSFDSPISSIQNLLRNRNANGYIKEDELVKSLRTLATDAQSKAVPLQVRAQNAAILINREEEYILFELFELSPQDDQVMQAKGRLIRSFPDRSYRIHHDRLLEDGLINALASHIAGLSCCEVPEFRFGGANKQNTSGVPITPTHPGLVTDYIASVLSALGTPTNTTNITKHTREEVNYSPASSPWRRSPLWLLIRVVLQLEFMRSAAPFTLARHMYKAAVTHLLSTVLVQAEKQELSPELLYLTSIKLSRRLRKLQSLDDDLSQVIINPIRTTLIDMHRRLDTAWAGIMEDTSSDINMRVLSRIKPRDDTQMNMGKLEKFLRLIHSRNSATGRSSFIPTSQCPEFDDVELLFAMDEAGEHRYFHLFIVENWVEEHLQAWLDAYKHERKSCERLSRLIMMYHRAAEGLYSESNAPSSLSMMYITIMELWIACDTCACVKYPLLSEYSTEINLLSLQSLSLPFKSQMKRLLKIERYVETRENRATPNLPSLFRRFGDKQSFPVRYFNSSEVLQDLQSQIERDAESKTQEKIEELRQKKNKYNDLIARSDKLTCNAHEVVYRGRGSKRKAVEVTSKCDKCRLRQAAEKISIDIYEKPLGASISDAKATVFEVNIPEAFSHWRDVTVHLLRDVLLFNLDTDRPRKASAYTLSRYDGLKRFLKGPSNRRIGLYSHKQPALGMSKLIKDGVHFLTDTDVCVENDLSYLYYDESNRCAMEKFRVSQKVQKRCTCKVPGRSLQLQDHLYPNISSNRATPNSVMASIHECPHHLSIDEYKALGLLPLGNRVRYINILTQLRAPTVDFTKSEAHCIMYHMIQMVGPPSNKQSNTDISIAREAHSILHDVTLCNAILDELNSILQKTQGNWETWRALAMCILLVLRVLTLTESSEIMSRCFEHLITGRQIAIKWIASLEQRLRNETNSEQRSELTSKKTEIALLCITTFDVDLAHINSILHEPDAISILLQISIIIRESKETVKSDYEYLHQTTLQSWRRFLFRLSPTIRDGLISGTFQAGFNSAVTAAWVAFQPSGCWNILEEPKHHWAHIKSGPDDVHFNFLTADLLVNGLPLDRLPDDYTDHETYTKLFNSIPMEVMPTNEPGMAFSTKHTFSNYKLSFGMDKQRQCMFVTASKHGEKLELIPQRVFEGVLPQAFVENYVHWFNYETKQIQFRALNNPWTDENDAWHLKYLGTSWQLENRTSILVAPNSQTGQELSKMLDPLDNRTHIHITIDRASLIVSIALVRLRLGFYLPLQGSSIYSYQYSGYIIDSNQRIETLVGLTSKLVLREEFKGESRTILVPEGSVHYGKDLRHMNVWVEQETVTKVHNYRLDSDLGRLEDNGSLQSKLLLCYLHALTSHFIVDRATGMTGTEAAVSIIRSAAVASFGFLNFDNVNLLSQIAKLTPSRKFTPASVQSMQQVSWDEKLPVLSQHSAFYIEVDRLFRHAETNFLFCPKENRVELPELKCIQSELLERDNMRSSVFRTDGFGAECFAQKLDITYSGRDALDSNRSQRASNIVTMLLREEFALFCKLENLQLSLQSKHLKNCMVKGSVPLEPKTLSFTKDWLDKPSQYLPRYWCSLHTAFSASPNYFNKFAVTMFLSTLAFAEGADMDVLQALAAFYSEPTLASVAVPQISIFHPEKGHESELSVIDRILRSSGKNFDDCPESQLRQGPNESWGAFYTRRNDEFRKNQNAAVDAFARALHSQWPCEQPTMPKTLNANTYIFTEHAMIEIRIVFKYWHDNRLFRLYIQDISNALNRLQLAGIPTICKRSTVVPEKQIQDEKSRVFSAKDIFSLKAPVSFRRRTRGYLPGADSITSIEPGICFAIRFA